MWGEALDQLNSARDFLTTKILTMSKTKAMTIPEYARKMGITKQTVYNHIKDGKLKTITVLGKKLIQI